MNEKGRDQLDQLLDLLATAVAERLATDDRPPTTDHRGVTNDDVADQQPSGIAEQPSGFNVQPSTTYLDEATDGEESVQPSAFSLQPSPRPSRLMARLAVGILLLVVLINVPFNTRGQALARSIPTSASLVIANGLLVQEDGSPDVWVFRDNSFHWISSLEAFQEHKYRWENVHTVGTGFLKQFPTGRPIYLLWKCQDSPHVFRIENSTRRWIADLETFAAEGHAWAEVKVPACSKLRALPIGESIPPGRGSPSLP